MTDGSDSRSTMPRKGRLWLALGAFAVVLFGVLIWQYRWMSDDGFINVRIVQNVLAGWGPVFNPGERVEAFTSPLWIAILSLLGGLGTRISHAAVGAGLIGSVVGLAAAQLGALLLRGGTTDLVTAAERRRAVPAGAVVYLAVPVTWHYGTSGLENGLTMLWLGGCFLGVAWHVVSSSSSENSWQTFVLTAAIGLGPLIRPELALFTVAFLSPLAVGAWRAHRRGELSVAATVGEVAALLALPIAYEIFRMGYFAALVPNTAVAKSAFDTHWMQGWHYARNFFGLYLLAFPLGILAAAWVRRSMELFDEGELQRATSLVAPGVAGLTLVLYVVRLGGGFMHGRLFLPAFFGMLLPVASVGLQGRRPTETRIRTAAGVALAAWAVACATYVRAPNHPVHGITDERAFYTHLAESENPVDVADFDDMRFVHQAKKMRDAAREQCPSAFEEGPVDESACRRTVYLNRKDAGRLDPHETHHPLRRRLREKGTVMAVLWGGGLRGVVLGSRIHMADRTALGDPIASRLEIESRGRPGHEKKMGAGWFVGRHAERESIAAPKAAAARRALECGTLASLDHAVTDPLTVGRFLRNLVLAPTLHTLDIPRNPLDARKKFCNPDGRRGSPS